MACKTNLTGVNWSLQGSKFKTYAVENVERSAVSFLWLLASSCARSAKLLKISPIHVIR